MSDYFNTLSDGQSSETKKTTKVTKTLTILLFASLALNLIFAAVIFLRPNQSLDSTQNQILDTDNQPNSILPDTATTTSEPASPSAYLYPENTIIFQEGIVAINPVNTPWASLVAPLPSGAEYISPNQIQYGTSTFSFSQNKEGVFLTEEANQYLDQQLSVGTLRILNNNNQITKLTLMDVSDGLYSSPGIVITKLEPTKTFTEVDIEFWLPILDSVSFIPDSQ